MPHFWISHFAIQNGFSRSNGTASARWHTSTKATVTRSPGTATFGILRTAPGSRSVRWSHYHLCQPADNSGLPMGGKDPSPVGLALAWVPSCRQYKAVTNNRFPLPQLASVAGCCTETAFREVTDKVPDKRSAARNAQ